MPKAMGAVADQMSEKKDALKNTPYLFIVLCGRAVSLAT
jgi:hypothetical protein